MVKTIYQLYLNGNGDEQICKLLNMMDIQSSAATKWHWSTIRNILINYNYTGDLILQKTYRENHLTKKKRINKGEFDQYLIKDDHEPIISKEIYHKAQRIRQQRMNMINSKPVIRKYAFSGMLKCGVRGRGYSHKSTPHNDIWKCSYALKRGVEACHSKQVPTEVLIEASNHILRRQEFDEGYFKSKVDFILVMPNRKLVFQIKDGTSEEYFWEEKSRSESWTPEMRKKARIKELNRLQGGVHHG